jgi:hypothetical protein
MRQIGRHPEADATGCGHVGMDENVFDGHDTSFGLRAHRTTASRAAPTASLTRINAGPVSLRSLVGTPPIDQARAGTDIHATKRSIMAALP